MFAVAPVDQRYLFEARQMQALSLSVHVPLVCFGIAFPALVLFAEWRYLATGDPLYRTLAKRWSKIMLALFAVGVVSVLAGVLAVTFSGYLAVVYLAADARRLAERALASDFRLRALAAGVVAGALSLAGLLVIRAESRTLWHGLTSGLGLALVVVSGLAGVVTMVLVWRSAFGLARASAAAGRATLIAIIVGVAAGAVVLVPSLTVLYSLVLRGRLDTAGAADAPAGADAVTEPADVGQTAGRARLAAGLAVVTLVGGVGLLVFADPAWAHGLGVIALLACAASVFGLVSGPPEGT